MTDLLPEDVSEPLQRMCRSLALISTIMDSKVADERRLELLDGALGDLGKAANVRRTIELYALSFH